MNFDTYKPVWLKAGILLALELADRGYKPVEIGLGERDFYVDVESDTTITLDKLKNIKLISKKFSITENNEVEYNSLKIKVKGNIELTENDPSYIEILNISTHHPEPQVQYVRIRGVGFTTERELKEYLEWLERASEIDHRILGEKLDLFSFHEEIGPGIVLFHPNGQLIRKELMKYMEEVNQSLGYQEVYTSHVMRSVLWKISGHYTLYRDKMLVFKHEDEELGVKPMNCPGHILIYKTRVRSYKDLPIRFSEFGHVYRWEKKGELYGLLRVRGFVQDDGHIFLREDQLKDEIKLLISKVIEVLSKFGFKGNDIKINLSTRPDESIGTDEQWEKATKALELALKELNLNYQIKEKEGAFYGPKIDFEIRDSLGRWWQLSTIQVDFNLPERFKLEYIDKDGEPKRPVMVHRAIYGSIDRFMAILIEHFRAKLPTWLSPIQVRIIPISKDNENYALQIAEKLRKEGVRVDMDLRDETLSKRIKSAYDDGIPYLVIVGRREEETSRITLRARGNIEVRNVKLEDFVRELSREIKEREIGQVTVEKLMKSV